MDDEMCGECEASCHGNGGSCNVNKNASLAVTSL